MTDISMWRWPSEVELPAFVAWLVEAAETAKRGTTQYPRMMEIHGRELLAALDADDASAAALAALTLGRFMGQREISQAVEFFGMRDAVLARQKGRENARMKLRTSDTTRSMICRAVDACLDAGIKKSAAVEQVADRFEKSKNHVYTLLRERRELRQPDREFEQSPEEIRGLFERAAAMRKTRAKE